MATGKRRVLDRGGGGRHASIRHPRLALGVEPSGIESVEQLAEAIGVGP